MGCSGLVWHMHALGEHASLCSQQRAILYTHRPSRPTSSSGSPWSWSRQTPLVFIGLKTYSLAHTHSQNTSSMQHWCSPGCCCWPSQWMVNIFFVFCLLLLPIARALACLLSFNLSFLFWSDFFRLPFLLLWFLVAILDLVMKILNITWLFFVPVFLMMLTLWSTHWAKGDKKTKGNNEFVH